MLTRLICGSSRAKIRAINMIALILIYLMVSCNVQPAAQTKPTPSSTQQSPSPEPPAAAIETPTSVSKPTYTPPKITEVPTSTPSSPPAIQSSSGEPESTPFVPVIGAADKIAFIEQNEIWIANLNGGALIQLTHDGLNKSALHWSPTGEKLFFISGGCISFTNFDSIVSETLACFDEAMHLDSFQISPDGTQTAISLDGELYVVPFDQTQLSQARTSADLVEMGSCASLAPYKHRQSLVIVKKAYWSQDGDRLAILREAFEAGKKVEVVHVLDISRCTAPLPRLDEFPATRFEMENYSRNPIIQNFAWDGGDLFALTDFRRNDGFGDLWIYNTYLHRGFKANPIGGKCCYRDPVFSPDGKYLAFAFQDASLAPDMAAVLYYMPYAVIDSSLVLPPLSLPEEFFSEPRSKPQPVLRSAP